ncbi:MAG: choice-of-anchor L domain-containing protein, partial [Nannocystaceae bacterium]|nr:choice-of-anchor L domain-containing protein [Nannocystaceae bacterium]
AVATTEPPIEPPVVFDFGAFPDVGAFCGAPSPVSCDDEDDDPWHAMGLNCAGGPQVTGSFTGDAQQLYIHQGNFGTSDAFPPREGEKFAILSSGVAQQMVTTVGGTIDSAMGGGNLFDLPPPMTRTEVSPGGGDTCVDNPALVGTGDCSNTVEVQYSQGGTANDLAFLSLSAEVPANTFGFSYDFAFFSVEYPAWYQSQFNDMYVAWLESEAWTGNISFDEFGSPISLNAGFLDYKDATNPFDCPAPCQAPELAGTAAQGHAGTRWLTSSAPVVPGETVEVYFAIFDLADSALDSAVLLDNWQWTCEGSPPVTIPG